MPRKKATKPTETAPETEPLEETELELDDGDFDEPTDVTEPGPDENAEKGKDELYEVATRYRIRGRRRMSEAELRAAVSEAQAQGVEPVIDGVDVDEGEDTLPGTKTITVEQVRLVKQATLEQLEVVVQDPKLEPHLRAYVQGEIEARQGDIAEIEKRRTLTSPMQRFRVTKGGMFVPMGGPPTTLPVGSMVMATTHDLEAVKKQGIEFVPCDQPKVLHDQLGRPYTSFE